MATGCGCAQHAGGSLVKGSIYTDGCRIKQPGKPFFAPKKADRFGWKTKYQKYTKAYGHGGKIGGNAFQIPYWTSAKRKSYAFDKKDPLKPEDIKALKEGKVLQMM